MLLEQLRPLARQVWVAEYGHPPPRDSFRAARTFVEENPFVSRCPLKGLRTTFVPQLCMSACEAIAGFALDRKFLQQLKQRETFSCNGPGAASLPAFKETQIRSHPVSTLQSPKHKHNFWLPEEGRPPLTKAADMTFSPPAPLSQYFSGGDSPVTELRRGLMAALGSAASQNAP